MYPQSVCVCSAVTPFAAKARLIILQHPNESQHAKNTVRLVKLCNPDTQLIVGECPEDFDSLRHQIQARPQSYALVYPNNMSESIQQATQSVATLPYEHLIFIDATWRKAFRIWKLNPWLQTIKSLHLESTPSSQYQIRKAPEDNHLSTLEAIATVLQEGYQQNARPLIDLFTTWQKTAFSRHGSFQNSSENQKKDQI